MDLAQARERRALQSAMELRDQSIVAEIERRFAEALADCAELAGVSVDYIEELMRRAWRLPPGDISDGAA